MENDVMDLYGHFLILPHDSGDLEVRKIKNKLSKTFEYEQFTVRDCTDPSANVKYAHYKELSKVEVIFHVPLEEKIGREIMRLICRENPLAGIGESWLYLNAFKLDEILHETSPKLISFGLGSIVHMNTFVEHYSSAWSKNDIVKIKKPKVCFKHVVRKLEITFIVEEQKKRIIKTHTPFMLELDYSLLMRILVEVPNENTANTNGFKLIRLYLIMSGAPLIKAEDVKDSDGSDSPIFVDKMKCFRESEFGVKNTNSYCSSHVFGMSRVLLLELECTKTNESVLWDTIMQISCSCEAEVLFTSMEKYECKTEFKEPSIKSDFSCMYALKTITSPSFSVTDEINLRHKLPDINRKLNDYAEEFPEVLEKSLFQIQAQLEKGEVLKFVDALESMVKQNKDNIVTTKSIKKLPNEIIFLRRVLLTPTRTVFLPPIAHMLSFLLREHDPDFALRITIRDDNLERLKHGIIGAKPKQTEFLRNTIGKQLMKGFRVHSREFQFFGASSSQLRENGALFYAEDNSGKTANSIRVGLGDLQKITNVAKYMARMGQSLSQAMCNLNLEKKCIEETEDVKMNEYVFSDGIGQMSQELADECHEELKDDGYKPCAIQIRYGGCKGMLLLNKELKEKKMLWRKSMLKFESENTSLEILKKSFPRHAYLNRPFITILEQMGVDKTVFVKLQTDHLQEIIRSLYKSENAVNLLHHESALQLPFKRLQKCGVNLSFEPFFRPMIMALYSKSIALLKTKARIRIPFSEARTMFGVMDETGTLEYGEVFVQYTKKMVDGKPQEETEVLTGTVLITKNPCMHPGDVRKFTAKPVKELMHVKDCVVFPQKGPRPHPNEMAGSDLDGDEYCVVWHKPLIFQQPNKDAMNYTFDKKQEEGKNIEVQDMINFLCDYIQHDNVGLIASAHLVWADTKGIFSEVCTSLAKKYSITLDFAKTGELAGLEENERPHSYPDYMEKFRLKDSYMSMKVLGYLFRNCKSLELVSNALSSEIPTTVDENILYEGWEQFKCSAEEALVEYYQLLSTPTQLFHLSNEGEIVSGAVKNLEKTFQGGNIEKNLSKLLETVIPFVAKKMKANFYKEFLEDSTNEAGLKELQSNVFHKFVLASNGNLTPDSITPLLKRMLQKASAWYFVAYKNKQENSSLFVGLPWTISELLGILHALHKSKIPTLEDIIRLNLQNERELQVFLDETPSSDQVDLSKQVMQSCVQQMVGGVNFSKSDLIDIRNILDSAMNLTINSKNVLSVKAEELVSRYMHSVADSSVSSDLGNGTGKKHLLKKALGVFMIGTISAITSTKKLWNTRGDINVSTNVLDLQVLTRQYREEICFPLERGRRLYNRDGTIGYSEFRKVLEQDTTRIIDLLQRFSRVDQIKSDFIQKGKYWYVVLSVYGKPFNIETLKDVIIQPSFEKNLIKYVKSDCCVM